MSSSHYKEGWKSLRSRARSEQEVRVRVHRRRDENHIGSQFGRGVAVLVSSQVLQVTPHIVGLMPGVPGHELCLITSDCQSQ